MSLLYQHGPDTLKLILIDPKRVELPAYAGIPHFLVPPVTKAEGGHQRAHVDGARNGNAAWTCSRQRARVDIASYNRKSDEQMPYIVVVIDELADLMSTSARDVGGARCASRKWRAVGIHLVLATQRPSVDIITGTIKANIPTRIAFAVASQSSRTILDYAGAEKLLGRGDMPTQAPRCPNRGDYRARSYPIRKSRPWSARAQTGRMRRITTTIFWIVVTAVRRF